MVRLLIFVLAVALTAVVAITALRSRAARPDFEILAPSGEQAVLPALWPVPEFSLIERSARPFSSAELKGKVWVADFFYTTCPGPCPMLTSRLSDLHKELGAKSAVRLVSISSDPEKDTPEILREYAQRFGASDRWFFLTGPKPEIYKLANEGFKLALAEDPNSKEPITHSTKLVLIDRAGLVRGFYDGVDGDGKRLLQDVRRLEKE